MLEQKEMDDVLKLDEIDSYFLIDECGAFMWRMNHDMAHDRIPRESHAAIQKDIEKIREVQKFAAENLTRFGIDPESAKDRKNGDYWKWYKFWDDWKKGLSDEDWNKVNALMQAKESFDQYKPKGSWKEYKLE